MRLIDADALLADVGEEPFNWTDTPEEIREVSDYKYYVGPDGKWDPTVISRMP